MKLGFDDIKDFFEIPAIIIASLITISSFSKTVRDYIKSRFDKIKTHRKAKRDMPYLIKNMANKMEDYDERLKKVEHEMSPNSGGSLNDKISMIQAEIKASNWLSQYPSFRCTSSGINTFVNEAYCELCDCRSEDLLKLSWRNFTFDDVEAEEYYNRWIRSSETFSQFVGNLKYKDLNGDYRGEWLVRIRPLGPITIEGSDDYLWHGTLYPFDEVAIEHQNRFGGY